MGHLNSGTADSTIIQAFDYPVSGGGLRCAASQIGFNFLFFLEEARLWIAWFDWGGSEKVLIDLA